MRNVPLGGAVRIYTTTGALVRELQDSDGDGIVTWDGRNSSGQAAASGTYLMAGKGKEGTLRRGKVVIIR
jgi:flagellar hook assembly protein FlgD